jgi:hypothetical protein
MVSWLVVLGCLLAAGAGLALADAVILHPLLPQPPTSALPERLAAAGGSGPAFDAGRPGFGIGLGFGFRERPGFGYAWLLSTAAVLTAAGVAAALLVPARVRVAVERIEGPGGLLMILLAGAVTLILVGAASLLLRYTFVIGGVAPLLWFGTIVALVFGVAGLGVFAGRRLRRFLGGAPPLLLSVAGVVLVVDIALIPFAGWLFGALAVIAALGVAVVTRFGSADGWSLAALDWPAGQSTG